MVDCDRYYVLTDGRLREGVLWDYASRVESLLPGKFLICIRPEHLKDLLKEPGVVEAHRVETTDE